jgi:hypothetical protein
VRLVGIVLLTALTTAAITAGAFLARPVAAGEKVVRVVEPVSSLDVGETIRFTGLDWRCTYKVFAGGRQVFCGRASTRAGVVTVTHPHRVQVLEYGRDGKAVRVAFRALRTP